MDAFADCECDKETTTETEQNKSVCCKSLLADCAACEMNMSKEEFCENNTEFPGCSTSIEPPEKMSESLNMKTIEDKILQTLQDVKFSEEQKHIQLQKESILKHKMARSCGPDYNLNKVTNFNKFECRYLGIGELENGKKVKNPFQTWRGTLPSCDDSVVISDELMEDIKIVAYDAAGGDDAKLNLDEFLCNITSLPIN